jgi:hypothetical protein
MLTCDNKHSLLKATTCDGARSLRPFAVLTMLPKTTTQNRAFGPLNLSWQVVLAGAAALGPAQEPAQIRGPTAWRPYVTPNEAQNRVTGSSVTWGSKNERVQKPVGVQE